MISNINELPFLNQVSDLFNRMPVMTASMMMRTLNRITGVEGHELKDLAKLYLNYGVLLMSENEYVTTKSSLPMIAENNPEVKEIGTVRVGSLEVKKFYKSCIQCFPVVLDLYPSSADFRISKDLFNIYFTNTRKGTIYEIIKIPADNKAEIFRNRLIYESSMYSLPKFEQVRKIIRRIAVVEHKAYAQYVPYVGFNFICQTDDSPKGFTVIEKREDDLWRDMPQKPSSCSK